MAIFTNYATLSYNGRSTNSNTVTGELMEAVAVTKTAVSPNYSAEDDITYIISLINSGSTPLSQITVTDDLGGYAVGAGTVYPLSYTENSVRYYINGVLQPAPAVTAGPPMVISGISVPAGGNAIIVYQADVTAYAPLAAGASVTNTVTVTGNGISTAVTANETASAISAADLSISKAVSPGVVTENGQLTYTFVIENRGSAPASAAENVIVTDTFNPVLNPISVTFNGAAWTEGTNYSYNSANGEFATLAGQITVPAAGYTQNADGSYTVTPGIAVLVVSGTV